jgi:general secretion pathway protein D
VTYLLRVKYIDVYKLSSILRRLTPSTGKIVNFPSQGVILLVQYASNLRRLLRIVKALDVPESETKDHMYLIQIDHGQAADIVQRVRTIFQIISRKRRRALRRRTTFQDEHILSKILADERTNRVIVVSSHKAYLNALSLIKKLDVPLEGEGKIRVHYLRYAKAEEIAQTLSQLAQGAKRVRRRRRTKKAAKAVAAQSTDLFGGELRITADKATNSLVIVSNKRDFDSLMKVIRKLDKRRKQVFVETVILEVSLEKTRDIGLAFHGGVPLDGNINNATSGNSPGYALFGTRLAGLNSLLFDPTTLTGLALGLAGPDIPNSSALLGGAKNIPAFGVIMRAIQTNNDVDIISTPHLLTATNQQASIEVGQNVPFIAGTSFSAAGVGLSFPVRNIQRQDVSLKMQIKPQINAGDRVKLEVDLELSEIASQNQELGPTTTKRRIKTVIRVSDKQTIVLGGLMRNKTTLGESKVPILGDIPVLGALFRFRNKVVEKRNLLIFMTPHIIYRPQDFQRIFLQKLKERQEFFKIYYAGRKGQLPKHIMKRLKLNKKKSTQKK